MVVFTCSYCGDSVKKNQVVKHYEFSCRAKIPDLTCVDCLKDFKGDEHVSHTSCVTEQERYSAKGFVSKPPSEKGKAKQESWMNCLRTIMESSPKLDGEVRRLLENIVQDVGVPQKKTKFLNYCTSKFARRFGDTTIERVWELMEKKREEWKNDRNQVQNGNVKNNLSNGNDMVGQEERKRKRVDSSKSSTCEPSAENDQFVREALSNDSESLNKKKKKKNKKDEENTNDNELEHDVIQNDQEDETILSKKAKKKKKRMLGNEHVETNDSQLVIEHANKESNDREEQEIENEESKKCDEVSLSKKERKEKRKREKYEKQLLEIQNEEVNHIDEDEQITKGTDESEKKKKKKKHVQENGDALSTEQQEAVETKSKKKKKHQELEDIAHETGNNNDFQEKEEESEVTKSKKFDWEETVIKVLESKGELPLKRLEKKVVSEYMNSGAHVESVEKVIAKFNKKIVKMPKVKVKKEVAKLVP